MLDADNRQLFDSYDTLCALIMYVICAVFELLQREGLSKYNKIYEFPYRLFNQNCTMLMTSVSGHLLNFEFLGQYKKWLAITSLVFFCISVQN